MDPERMWCSNCGRERHIALSATWTNCECGSTSMQSWDPATSFVTLRDLWGTGPYRPNGSLIFP